MIESADLVADSLRGALDDPFPGVLSPRTHTSAPDFTRTLTISGARPSADVSAVIERLGSLADMLAERAGADRPGIDGGLLAERERLSQDTHIPASGRSLRGATRLHRCSDGWLALNLARDDDRESLPALTGGAVEPAGDGLLEWCAQKRTGDVLARARLLGLAVGILPSATATATATASPFAVDASAARSGRQWRDRVVVDLSRLWAGPLAGALLAESGAHVIRLVDVTAPATVEPTDAAFESRLHSAKETRELDFADRTHLAQIIGEADIVITSMRPHALARFPAARPDALHLAITAHGTGSGIDRVGFGDDCAVEGGLVAWYPSDTGGSRPEFLGDAIADPLTGIIAAVAAFGMAANGRAGRVDMALSQVAAWTASVSAIS
ncbi:CoA transferase [Microbacterium sp. A94]|uniref:CoA transferase n=1 Tax=Microbacterium sp. A94 TaxID=3450717 RepID=UPI003F437A11